MYEIFGWYPNKSFAFFILGFLTNISRELSLSELLSSTNLGSSFFPDSFITVKAKSLIDIGSELFPILRFH